MTSEDLQFGLLRSAQLAKDGSLQRCCRRVDAMRAVEKAREAVLAAVRAWDKSPSREHILDLALELRRLEVAEEHLAEVTQEPKAVEGAF